MGPAPLWVPGFVCEADPVRRNCVSAPGVDGSADDVPRLGEMLPFVDENGVAAEQERGLGFDERPDGRIVESEGNRRPLGSGCALAHRLGSDQSDG